VASASGRQELSITSPSSHWFWQDWFCSRMISHLWESSEELIHRTQLEQNCPRVDTSRSARRTVLHHLPHPSQGEKLSANRNILLMIPPEKEREKWVQDPSLCQLGQEALFPSHTPESSWLSGRRGWAQRREVTSKITAPLVSYRKAMYKLFGKHYLQSSLCLLMDTQMHPMLVSPLLGFPRTDSKDKGLRQSAYCRVDLVRI
jgi:hypothetical protein